MDPGFAARLTEPFLLALLKEGPNHGYGLLLALQEALGEEHVTKPRVYQILRRLREEGLVEAGQGKGNKIPYVLTEQGEAYLEAAGSQRPAFFKVLSVLFPDMDVGVVASTTLAEELPRDGARTQQKCPGCQSLHVQMERTLPADELVIRVMRHGETQMHAEGCVIGLALRRLAASLLP